MTWNTTIMLADEDPRRRRALRSMLASLAGCRLLVPAAGLSLPQALTAAAPELLLLGLRAGVAHRLRELDAMPDRMCRAIVLFAPAAPGLLTVAADAGVVAWFPDIPPGFPQSLSLIRALVTREREQAAALAEAQARATERGVIEQAKRLLMQQRHMSEPDAYRWLRRQAMAGGQRIADLARTMLLDTSPPEA